MIMPRDKHERILTTLTRMATAIAPVARSRHAAALVYRNEIISFGVNRKKSHPFQKRYAKHEDAIDLHAETDAIQRALREYDVHTISRASLYVLRVKYTDSSKAFMTRGMSKPCEGCSRAIATFGIKRVYFTNEEGICECL